MKSGHGPNDPKRLLYGPGGRQKAYPPRTDRSFIQGDVPFDRQIHDWGGKNGIALVTLHGVDSPG